VAYDSAGGGLYATGWLDEEVPPPEGQQPQGECRNGEAKFVSCVGSQSRMLTHINIEIDWKWIYSMGFHAFMHMCMHVQIGNPNAHMQEFTSTRKNTMHKHTQTHVQIHMHTHTYIHAFTHVRNFARNL
jgi:hypothetical protein